MTVSISTRTSGTPTSPDDVSRAESKTPAQTQAPTRGEPAAGHSVEAFPKSAKTAEPPQDLFASVFSLIGNLFKPQSNANGQPTFDLARILSDVLNGIGSILGGPEQKPEAKADKKPEGEAKKLTEDEQKAAKAEALANQSMNQKGEVDSGNATIGNIKIGPGAGDGVQGISDAGQLNIKGQADLGGGTTASGSVRGGTFAGVKVSPGSVQTNAKGELVGEVGVGVAVGARIRAEGQVSGKWGNVSGYVGAEAQLYAKGRARFRVGKDSAGADAEVGVGALAGVEAGAKANVLGGLVKGQAAGEARSGAGADAKAGVVVKYDPPEAAFKANAGAFAGARAGFQAEGTIAGVGYNISAEAWAGVGVKASVDAGIKDGKFSFQFGAGVAVGVGVAFKVGFSMDTKNIGGIIKGVFGAAACVVGAVGQIAGPILKPVGDALGAITKPFGDIFGGLFKAVGGLFGGGKGNGSVSKDAVDVFSALAKTPKGLEGSTAGRDAEVSNSDKVESKQDDTKPRPKPEAKPAPQAQPLQDAVMPSTRTAVA